jgi:D-sedoheptulose 7-phosphate isomerase
MREIIQEAILESIRVKEELLKNNLGQIVEISKKIIESLKKGGKLIIFGNGGSASDAQHIAAELVGRFKKDRPALPAISLTVNTSIITALANDFGYDIIFSRQIEALAVKTDIALGISTSGKAKNVILALKQAKKMGLFTIALTGGDGGEIVKQADIALIVPSLQTARIQESHILIGHIICELVEEAGIR